MSEHQIKYLAVLIITFCFLVISIFLVELNLKKKFVSSKILKGILLFLCSIIYYVMLFYAIKTNDLSIEQNMLVPINTFSSILFCSSILVAICELFGNKITKTICSIYESTVVLLMPALLFASFWTSIWFINIHNDFAFTIACDAIMHVVLFLLGYEILRNREFQFSYKSLVKAIGFGFSFYTSILLVNIIFHCSYAGIYVGYDVLPYFEPVVYGISITKNCVLNILIYYFGFAFICSCFYLVLSKVAKRNV